MIDIVDNAGKILASVNNANEEDIFVSDDIAVKRCSEVFIVNINRYFSLHNLILDQTRQT